MGQFFPRTVRALLRDRPSQLAHGLFAATFASGFLAIRQLDDQGSRGGSIRGLTLLVAYLLMLVSVVALVFYVHHAGQALRAAGLIDLVGTSCGYHAVIERAVTIPGVPAQAWAPARAR